MNTTLTFDEVPKRLITPVKSSEVKSKYELFKQNYHKPSPSDAKVEHHQVFVSLDNMQSKN